MIQASPVVMIYKMPPLQMCPWGIMVVFLHFWKVSGDKRMILPATSITEWFFSLPCSQFLCRRLSDSFHQAYYLFPAVYLVTAELCWKLRWTLCQSAFHKQYRTRQEKQTSVPPNKERATDKASSIYTNMETIPQKSNLLTELMRPAPSLYIYSRIKKTSKVGFSSSFLLWGQRSWQNSELAALKLIAEGVVRCLCKLISIGMNTLHFDVVRCTGAGHAHCTAVDNTFWKL